MKRLMKQSAWLLISVFIGLSWVPPVSAALVNTQIRADGAGSIGVSPSTFTVSPRGLPDFNVLGERFFQLYTGDVFDDGIELTSNVSSDSIPFTNDTTIRFSDLNWGGTGSLDNVSISSTGFGTAPTITFAGPGSTEFTLNLAGVSPELRTVISITLTPSHPVPTPSAILLMGTGLVGLIGFRTWNKSQT